MGATAILIDSREPEWVLNSFAPYGVDTVKTLMETGDALVACEDGSILQIERKTPDDLLGSIRDGRLFDQVHRLVEPRLNQVLNGKQVTNYPYLVITGAFIPGANRAVHTGGRETSWSWNSVWGALLKVQEMGCFVTVLPSDTEYAGGVMMLAERDRRPIMPILPARMPVPMDARSVLLCDLPGIGIERAKEILSWSGGNLAHALAGLTDMRLKPPPGVGEGIRKRIRGFMGLDERSRLDLNWDEKGNQVLEVRATQPALPEKKKETIHVV